MNQQAVNDLADPRILLYRNLKDRELARLGDLFIAEGEPVALRLLHSDFPAVSVLVAQRKLERVLPHVRADLPLYVAPARLVNQIVGFKFHSGVLAVGRRKPSPTVEQVLSPLAPDARVTLVICPEISNTENLGTILRVAAGFGATAMILGERCCDPFYRQSIRVSMGAVFSLPIVQSLDIAADLRELKQRWGVQLAATVLDADAESLASATRPPRLALLFGGEAQGLSDDILRLCDRRITIPMQLGTDSLNVAVAAGVLLYHFTL